MRLGAYCTQRSCLPVLWFTTKLMCVVCCTGALYPAIVLALFVVLDKANVCGVLYRGPGRWRCCTKSADAAAVHITYPCCHAPTGDYLHFCCVWVWHCNQGFNPTVQFSKPATKL